MDTHTLKILLEQIDIEIDKYKINMTCEEDNLFFAGMLLVRTIIKKDLERLENIKNE